MTTRSLAIYLIVGAAILISKTVTSEGPLASLAWQSSSLLFQVAISSSNGSNSEYGGSNSECLINNQSELMSSPPPCSVSQDGTVTVARGTLTGAVTVGSDDLTRLQVSSRKSLQAIAMANLN